MVLRRYFEPLQRGLNVIAFQASGIDQELLTRFFVATLWRASVSTHPFFSRVQLGPKYEDQAKSVVTKASIPVAFGVTMACWLDINGKQISKGFMDPVAERYQGRRTYRFDFGQYLAYVKVDQRPFAEPFLRMALGSEPTLIVIRRDYASSKDYAAMVTTAYEQQANAARMREIHRKSKNSGS